MCLLYAMELSPHINRPIGLIESDWGGTPVEAWSSPDARSACGHRQKRYYRKDSKHFDTLYLVRIITIKPKTKPV